MDKYRTNCSLYMAGLGLNIYLVWISFFSQPHSLHWIPEIKEDLSIGIVDFGDDLDEILKEGVSSMSNFINSWEAWRRSKV